MKKRIKKAFDEMIDKHPDGIVNVCLLGIVIGMIIQLFSIYSPIEVEGLVLGVTIFLLSILCLEYLICRDDMKHEETYKPSQMIGKCFTYDGKQYIIYQYVCNGQNGESCYFKCRLVNVDDYIIWHEEELKKAIANDDVEVEI